MNQISHIGKIPNTYYVALFHILKRIVCRQYTKHYGMDASEYSFFCIWCIYYHL